jgi:hypothetical protein
VSDGAGQPDSPRQHREETAPIPATPAPPVRNLHHRPSFSLATAHGLALQPNRIAPAKDAIAIDRVNAILRTRVMELDVEPREWELFEAVDRDRGDALLAIAWAPDAPGDW